MLRPFRLILRQLALPCALLLGAVPAAAQSVLRDAETEALFHDLTSPLVVAAGLDPKNVDIVLVNDADVPEPASLAILGSGLAAAGWMRRRKTA